MDLPPQAVRFSQAEARPADPQARLAEHREARTKRSVSQRSRGARWSFRASDSARPGFHEWAVAAALAGTADERKAYARAWNDANCAQRHFAARARLGGEAGRRRDNAALARLLAAAERA